jgi:hypothetical protein
LHFHSIRPSLFGNTSCPIRARYPAYIPGVLHLRNAQKTIDEIAGDIEKARKTLNGDKGFEWKSSSEPWKDIIARAADYLVEAMKKDINSTFSLVLEQDSSRLSEAFNIAERRVSLAERLKQMQNPAGANIEAEPHK